MLDLEALAIIERHPNLIAIAIVFAVYVIYVNWKSIVLMALLFAIFLAIYMIIKAYRTNNVPENRNNPNRQKAEDVSSSPEKTIKAIHNEEGIVSGLKEEFISSSDSTDNKMPNAISKLSGRLEPKPSVVSKQQSNDVKVNMDYVDSLNGREFELFTGKLLKLIGYQNVTVTKSSGDQGIDVIGTLNNKKVGFQCKHYQGNVGNRAVQELYAGVTYYGCDSAVLVSNSLFTDSAQELAKRLDIDLWDRNKLTNLISQKNIVNHLVPKNESGTPSLQNKHVVSTGLHIVGRDIDPGRYRITAPKGIGTLSGKDFSILIGETLDDEYALPSYTTDFKVNDRIKISGIPELCFNPILDRHYRQLITPGTWKVGIDVASGFYKMVAKKGRGRVWSTDYEFDETLSSSPTKNYEVPSVTVELLDGQDFFTDVPEILLIELQ